MPSLDQGSEKHIIGTQDMKEFEYTADWFSHHIPIWNTILAEYRGQPHLNYLEVGVFEGRSLIWMLTNILTHSSCRATAVDFFGERLQKALQHNLKQENQNQRVDIRPGSSQEVLRTLPLGSYDLIYIDGGHRAHEALTDAILSWDLLKTGGVLILDDYLWQDGILPVIECPKMAFDAFLSVFRGRLDVLHSGYQLILRKRVQ